MTYNYTKTPVNLNALQYEIGIDSLLSGYSFNVIFDGVNQLYIEFSIIYKSFD